MMRARCVIVALLLGVLAGCVTAPPVSRPELVAPGYYKTANPVFFQTPSADGLRPMAWLREFGDPVLDALLARALPENIDLKVLAVRMDAARAEVRLAGAERWPQVSAGASVTRQKFSARSSQGQLVEQAGQLDGIGIRNPQTFWQVGPQVAYEIDLWGRIAKAREAAQAELRAEVEDYDAAAISVTVELARSYFGLRIADRRIALLDARRADVEKLLRIARERLNAGAADANEARREAAELSGIVADIAETQSARAALENRIATLVGASAAGYRLYADAKWSLPARRSVPAGLPAELLTRRPDLRAANERFVAAQERIGEAKAAALPSVTLTGAYGFTSDQLRTLVRGNATGWTFGPSISIPLFTGFRNQARVDAAVAQAREAGLAWQRTALIAFEEVESALSSVEAQQIRARRAEETLSQLLAIELSLQQQVEIGRRAGLEALRIRSEVRAAQDRVLAAKQSELEAQLLLIRALGGDWRA